MTTDLKLVLWLYQEYQDDHMLFGLATSRRHMASHTWVGRQGTVLRFVARRIR